MSSISMFSEEKGKEVYEVELSSGVVENEEYEERVVVRGRWGVGAGEFGIMYKDDQEYKPESLAVDSKGNIYILDLVNNRIQKFSNDGRYLLSIPVDSLKGEVRYWEGKPVKNEVEGMEGTYLIEPTETRGVNIVIDSKDNLYYYCIKGDKGEVWMFKDDKLVKRWGEETGESKPLLDKEVKKFQDRWVDVEIDELSNKLFRAKLKGRKDKEIKFILDRGIIYGRSGYDNNFCQWLIRVKIGNKVFIYYYDDRGRLIKKKQAPPPAMLQDNKGNCYDMIVDDNGVKIVKYELIKLKEYGGERR